MFLTTRDGEVRCIDVAAKEVAWAFKADAPVLEPPDLGAENVYVRDQAGVIYALGPGGALLWKRPAGEKVTTPIAEGGGRIHFGTEKDGLRSFRLDGADDLALPADGPVISGPVVSGGRIVFASGDGTIHVHDLGGKALWSVKAPGPVAGPLGSDGDRVFFSTEDRRHFCWRVGAKKPRWKVRLGGLPAAKPVVDKGRLYLLGTNSVLYCLKASGGDVLWWANVPSRAAFDFEVADGKVIVASLSPVLLAFDAVTGRNAGEFNAGWAIASNAVWSEPFLAAARYDAAAGTGALVRLAKEVGVKLTTPKASPRPAGEEVPFTAVAVGLHEPRFEFYIKTPAGREVAQKSSEKATWAWFAETEGSYTLGVVATDERQSREAEVTFVVEKRTERKSPETPAKKAKTKKTVRKEKTTS